MSATDEWTEEDERRWEEFAAHLDGLDVERLANELTASFDFADPGGLAGVIREAISQFFGRVKPASPVPKTLDQFEELSRELGDLLSDKKTFHWIADALGGDVGSRIDELHALDESLTAIRAAIQEARPRRRRPKNEVLHSTVELLMRYWSSAKGERPTRDWHGHEPVSPAMRFVHRVMTFIAPWIGPKLPAVTKAVAKKRLQ